MPSRKFTRRRRTRRSRPSLRRGRGYGSYKPTNLIATYKNPWQTGSPNHMVMRMRFSLNEGTGHVLTSTAGAVQDYVYRANDMYDPYASAGGQQARLFDQIMPLYRHFVVLSSKIKVNYFYDTGSTSENAMVVALVGRDFTSAISLPEDIQESSRGTWSVLTPAKGIVKLSRRYSYKFFNVKDPSDEDSLHGTVGASPTEQYGFHVCGYSADGSSTQTCRFNGHIDFVVKFIHPIQPAQS